MGYEILIFSMGLCASVGSWFVMNYQTAKLLNNYRRLAKVSDHIEKESEAFIESLFAILDASAKMEQLMHEIIDEANGIEDIKEFVSSIKCDRLAEVEEVKRSYYGG